MHREVVRLVALDQVLWLFLRGMHSVAFERDFGSMLFPDRSSDPPCSEFHSTWSSTLKSSVIGLNLSRRTFMGGTGV
jgi:hypothetical protein